MGQQNPAMPYQGRAAIDMQVFNNTVMAPKRASLPREPFLTVYAPEHHGMYRNYAASNVGSGIMTHSPDFDMVSQPIGLPEYEGMDDNFYDAGNSGWTANRTFSSNGHGMNGSLL